MTTADTGTISRRMVTESNQHHGFIHSTIYKQCSVLKLRNEVISIHI